MDCLYTLYGKVDDIELEKNQVTMMMAYTPELPMAIRTNQLEEGRKQSIRQTVRYGCYYYFQVNQDIEQHR